jgi:hypothetical protein
VAAAPPQALSSRLNTSVVENSRANFRFILLSSRLRNSAWLLAVIRGDAGAIMVFPW